MSGLADILHTEGFTISGPDNKESDYTRELSAKGISILYGQKAENITADLDLVVYTAAIRDDNPEFLAAKAMGIPMLTRAELLGQIMENYQSSIAISGTHGKTTTTSMMSEILLEAKGFTDVVVSIADDSCDVVLNMGEVTDAKRAQVEDIVKRKTNIAGDKIVITPIVINEASK